MKKELEQQVISALIDQPILIETDGLTILTFSDPKYKKIFEVLSGFREDAKTDNTDLLLLSEKSDVSLSELMGILGGALLPKASVFAGWVRRLRQMSLAERCLRLSQAEAELLVKTGEMDIGNTKELMGIWKEITDLEQSASGPVFKRLDQIEGRTLEWLWYGRIPQGMISLLVGDPGLGKSFLAIWLGSKLSVGASLPRDPGPPLAGSTIYLSAEDSPTYALQPRASQNGADLSKIILPGDLDFNISSDLPRIREILKENPSVRLLIIDPLNSYLGKTDYFKDPEVRIILNPLIEFCEETGIACLAVMHLNKKADLGAIYRIGGSIAFAGVARSIMGVTQDPGNKDRRLLGSIKMNHAKKPDTLAFRIGEDLSLSFDEGPVDADFDESLSPPAGKEATEGTFAMEWLAEQLEDGPANIQDIFRSAERVRISRSALFRAKNKLRLISHPSGFGKGRQTYWGLPDDTSLRECNETNGTNGTDETDESGKSPINPINPISLTFTQSGIESGMNGNPSCPELSNQTKEDKNG